MPDGVLQTANSDSQSFGLTDNAAKRIAALLQDEEDGGSKFMRVAVEGGGCSGFQYIFSFDGTRNEDDLAFENGGVTVVVDAVSLDLVSGGVLDYVEELIGSYFQVVNPNASSSCGCGTSFSL